MEKFYEYNNDIHLIFIDFKQAYDCTIRNQHWTILINFVISSKLVRLIKSCNKNTMCQVHYLGETSKSFEVKTGLRQGDPLSPVLFNLSLEQMIRDMKDNRSMELVGNRTLLACPWYCYPGRNSRSNNLKHT